MAWHTAVLSRTQFDPGSFPSLETLQMQPKRRQSGEELASALDQMDAELRSAEERRINAG